MFIEKKRFSSLITFLLLSLTVPAIAMDDELDLNNPDLLNTLNNTNFNITRAAISPAEIAQILIDLGAPAILQEDLFCATYPLNTRNIIDFPEFLPQLRCYAYNWVWGAHFFWNQLDRGYFTKNSTQLCSYIAIQSPDLLEAIGNSLDIIDLVDLGVSPLDILPLFANMSIQERRLGTMLYTQRQLENSDFRIIVPVYYLERNFFLTEREQLAIEDVLGSTSNDEADLFAKRHLISDKFGLGDMRITYDANVFERWDFDMRLGLLLDVPTAFAVASGLLGTSFNKRCARPTLSLTELFELGQGTRAQKAEAAALGEAFVLGALDNFAANLLETPLGLGHWGIGTYALADTDLNIFIKRPWADNFVIRSRWQFEYLLPANEIRLFVAESNQQSFEALGLNRPKAVIDAQIADDPAYAQAVLSFLEGELVDKFYPYAFTTRVRPGIIFHSTTKLLHEGPCGGFHIGSDFWAQTGEKLSHINVRQCDGRPPNIDIWKATKPRAYQSKVIGSAFIKVHRPERDWIVGLNGDVTVWGSGIGDDFTLSFNFETNF